MGTMRVLDPLPFDVAHATAGGRPGVFIVFVDDPSRSIAVQLQELPIVSTVQASPRVLVRSVDLDSIYDGKTKKWVALGTRHAALVREIDPRKCGEFSIIDQVDYRPDFQWSVLR
jgi:hypothetical protein